MSKILVVPDQHAHPDYNNDRAEWLGKFILDERPDVVVCIGDQADMPSLAAYDKGKRSFYGKSYAKDIQAHLDFQEKMWHPIKAAKKKMPLRIALIGNHEQRIDRVLDASPELEGTVSYKDLNLEYWYNDVIHYDGDTPGTVEVDGILFAHYFITGVMGRAVGGEHPGYTLLTKNFQSCVQGHTHVLDYCERTTAQGKKIMGLVCGVYQDYQSDWAGERNKLWWRGLTVLDNVCDGSYDLRCVSLNRLRQEYGAS